MMYVTISFDEKTRCFTAKHGHGLTRVYEENDNLGDVVHDVLENVDLSESPLQLIIEKYKDI